MATRTRGGNTGMAVALVVFVLLFVGTLIATIVIYSKVEETDQRAQQARERLDVYVKSGEDMTEPVKEVLSRVKEDKSGKSVVKHLIDERDTLLRTVASELKTVRALPEFLKSRKVPEGKPLLSEIESLRADLAQLTTSEATAKREKDATEAKLVELEKAKVALEEEYRKADAARTTQITQISAANDAAKTTADTTIKSIQDAQAAAAAEREQAVKDLEDILVAKQAEIEDLRLKLRRLEVALNPGGEKGGSDASREIDGVVLSLIPAENMVTIDLGKGNHLPLGMTFEVFDKKTGVTREFGDLRGKATIEVVRVKDSSSECRVVRQDRGKVLQEGDVIANVVYDRYRTFKFFVFGDFDIDNDGRPSPTDTRRIKSMIEQWGGEVVTEFSYEVDFLVLGVKPQPPAVPVGSDDIRTPVEIEAAARDAERALQFTRLEGDARLLRVPVLNQNRFLTLIGYYVRQ